MKNFTTTLTLLLLMTICTQAQHYVRVHFVQDNSVYVSTAETTQRGYRLVDETQILRKEQLLNVEISNAMIETMKIDDLVIEEDTRVMNYEYHDVIVVKNKVSEQVIWVKFLPKGVTLENL